MMGPMQFAHFVARDGTRIAFRHIRPDDKGRLAEALGRLSPQSRHRRFLMPKPRFSSAELRYLTEIDGFDHVAVVAVLADDPDVFVGVGRFVRLREDPETAEVAVVVGDALQGQGLGRALGRRLADEALENGVRRFTATLLGENVAAHRLLASISARLEGHLAGGHRELVADLAA
jgi:RimJ/RimL family protein N-acetyltransferase